MRILAHILVDVPACNLHVSTPLDEFYTPPPFLNAEVNGEGQVQCLHRKMLIIMLHGMFVNLLHLQGCSIVTARLFSINNQLSQGFVDHRVKEGQVMELYGPGKQNVDEGLIH